MGKTRHPPVRTPWFRVIAALEVVSAPAAGVWLAYREDVPERWRPWIFAGVASGVLTSGFSLVTGKTFRMKLGEVFGDRPPRHSIDGATITSKVEARWWLASMACALLAVLCAAGMLAAGLPFGWFLVPWGLALVSGLYWWWFWPPWTAGESEGSITRFWLRPRWKTASAWSAEFWREAFGLAGLPVSQVHKARAVFFTLLAGGTLVFFVASEAADPEHYVRADALVRDLEAEGSFWACNHVDVDGYGYERAPYESDATLCRRTGDRMFVHVYTAGSETRGPVLAPEEESIFTAWVRGPRWIVETTDRATAKEIAAAVGGRVTTDPPLE